MSIVDDGAQTEADDDDDDFVVQPAAVNQTTSTLSAASSMEAESAAAAEEVIESSGSTCPICFEGWTNNGRHKLVALKCGHLFGRSCIRKWLLSKPQNNQQQQQQRVEKKRCPDCKQPATTRDIRTIFARSLTAIDGAQVEELRAEKYRLECDLSALKGEAAEHMMRHHQMMNEVKRLRGQLDAAFENTERLRLENTSLACRIVELAGGGDGDPDHERKAYVPQLRLRATVAVAGDAGQSSRVLAVDPFSAVIYASHSHAAKQRHTMAAIDVGGNFNCTPPLLIEPALHTQEIRGAQVSPHRSSRFLLTASHDQTAVLTALGANGSRVAPNLAARLKLNASAWSCAWDPHDPNRCYVGTASSTVKAFDLRYPTQPLHTWAGMQDRASLTAGGLADLETGYSQIHSIAAFCNSGSDDQGQQRSRLVVANSHHVYALPAEPGLPWTQLTQQQADGQPRRSCYSLSHDAHLGCVAASFRTTTAAGLPSTVHDLYAASFGQEDGAQLDWRLLQRIPTQSPQNKLARSAVFSFIPPSQQQLGMRRREGLFCAVLEATRSVNVWPVAANAAEEEPREPIALTDVQGPENIVDVQGWQWGSGGDNDGDEEGEDGPATTLLASLTDSTIRLYDVR
ncbi:RING finger and WD repeat domain-containing protein 3 [Coemansia aciculifera]|nr:RING finger and WD repeat domain-containing protein 3 [Coemansia aciculifera]